MTTDLGQELRAMLAERDPGAPTPDFVARAAAVSLAGARPRPIRRLRLLRAVVAAGLAAALVAVVVLPRFAFGPGPAQPASPPAHTATVVNPTPTSPATPPPSSTPIPYSLLLGDQTATLGCGTEFPSLSVSTAFVLCDGVIRDWPAFQRTATIDGIAAGWGTIDGRDELLVERRSDFAATLVSGAGKTISIPGTNRTTAAAWSVDRTWILLVTGDRGGDTKSVARWTPSESRSLGSISLPGHVLERVQASREGTWLAAVDSSCGSPGGCSTTIGLRGPTGRTRVVADRLPGLLQLVSVGEDGSLVAVIRDEAAWKLFVAPPGMPLELRASGSAMYSAPELATVVTDAGLLTVDLLSATVAQMPLPHEMAGEIVGVGGDGRIATLEGTRLRIFPPGEPATVYTLPAAPSANATVQQYYEAWVFVFDGPPPMTTVIRR